MIYISTSSIRTDSIREAVETLYGNGFSCIELSGGTKFYPGMKEDLIDLQKKYNLHYICHNYFPPPQEDFVINLASMNDLIFSASMESIIRSMQWSRELGSDRYGFHAGFFLDVGVSEIGGNIEAKEKFQKNASYGKFVSAYTTLKKEAEKLSIQLYIENNVLSHANYINHDKEILFMLLNSEDYIRLKNEIDFKLLLDIAHLKVTSNTLGMDFHKELDILMAESDYIHISDNDGFFDNNKPIEDNSFWRNFFKKFRFTNRHITLEITGSMDELVESYRLVSRLLKHER